LIMERKMLLGIKDRARHRSTVAGDRTLATGP